jgi:hypothetical protein
MSTPDCRHVRVAVGGDPHDLAPDVRAHLETCAECRKFQAETLALDSRLRAALELPLAGFRKAAPVQARAPVRRYALAASVMLAVLLGGGFWLLGSQNALAGEIVEHVRHESSSWGAQAAVPAESLADVLRKAGVSFDTSMPVVYASACPFRGHRVPHLVVQTADGPVTVMILAHEKVSGREEFSEDGYRGVLVPAGEGSMAILARDGAVPDEVAATLVSGVRR